MVSLHRERYQLSQFHMQKELINVCESKHVVYQGPPQWNKHVVHQLPQKKQDGVWQHRVLFLPLIGEPGHTWKSSQLVETLNHISLEKDVSVKIFVPFRNFSPSQRLARITIYDIGQLLKLD